MKNKKYVAKNIILCTVVILVGASVLPISSGYSTTDNINLYQKDSSYNDVLCGDANNDSLVNVGDVIYLINYVFKGAPAPDPLCQGDANGDGEVNTGDPVYLITYIFNGGKPPVTTCCDPILQNILFEVCHVNEAWGHTFEGFYVDKTGNAYSYSDVPLPGASWDETHTEETLQFRHSYNQQLIGTIDLNTLYEKYQLIQPASEGELSDRVIACMDYGQQYYVAYQYDSDSGTYTPVLLHDAGDYAQKNFAEEAEQLFEWLQTIDYTNPPCTYP